MLYHLTVVCCTLLITAVVTVALGTIWNLSDLARLILAFVVAFIISVVIDWYLRRRG